MNLDWRVNANGLTENSRLCLSPIVISNSSLETHIERRCRANLSLGKRVKKIHRLDCRAGRAERSEPSVVNRSDAAGAVKTGQCSIDQQAKVRVVAAHHESIRFI